MNRSIRIRLMLSVLGLLVPVFVLAGWLLVQTFGHRLLHDVDVALEEEAETVGELLGDETRAAAIAEALAHIAGERDLGAPKYITLSRRGTVFAEAPDGARSVFTSSGTGLRVVRYHTQTADPLTVSIAVSAATAAHARNRLTSLLLIGIPLLLGALGTGFWVITGRALRPLEDTALRLGAIAPDTLSLRLPIENPRDEVGRVVQVVNAMLERLEVAVNQLRRFTADAAHELRTPLTVLRAGLEVALAHERPAADYRAALHEALSATDRIVRLAEDLLTLARLEAAPRPAPVETIEIPELLRELSEAWADVAAARGVQIAVAAPQTLAVQGTPSDLYRLFNNLLENALQHAAGATRIKLAARAVGAQIEVSITDDGCGIPPPDLARVFDRFYRGPQAHQHDGAGLGLSIAQEIARRHGGAVVVSTDNGCGVTATVWLPGAPVSGDHRSATAL